MLFILR